MPAEGAMNTVLTSRFGRAPEYTAACDATGYRVMHHGVVVKIYRLAPICYLLSARERVSMSAEFAAYDIVNARFMLA